MNWFPASTQTLVLPCRANHASFCLWRHIMPLPGQKEAHEKAYASQNELPLPEKERFLNGWVKPKSFKVSRRVKQPENFLPLVHGSIEATSAGCLVFMRYRLFPAAVWYLSFVCAVSLLLTFFFLFVHNKPWLAIAALAFGIGNYVLGLAVFKRQVNKLKVLWPVIFDINPEEPNP